MTEIQHSEVISQSQETTTEAPVLRTSIEIRAERNTQSTWEPAALPKTTQTSGKSKYPDVANYEENYSPDYKPSGVFKEPLSMLEQIEYVPVLVEDCICYLEENGLQEEGLFRVAGQAELIQRMKIEYNNGTEFLCKDSQLISIS